MVAAPALPPHGAQSVEDRRRICRRIIIHAREELEAGNRLQAGEKAWGAVVQPLKAIAEQRGWPHQSHRDVREVAFQIALEYGFDPAQVGAMMDAYRVGHENFYENHRSFEQLDDMIGRVEDLAPFLDGLTATPPRPFVIASNVQLRRLQRLTKNDGLAIGDASNVGFSLKHGVADNGGEE